MADALSRISIEHLSDEEEAKRVLEGLPVIPVDDTVFKVFEEKEEDWQPEKATPHTMSPEAMKAIFSNLTSGSSRRAEQEYNLDSSTHHKADFIEVSVKSVRLST